MTLAEIKAANFEYAKREDRAYWFARDAMRFFNTKILSGVYEGPGGVFFVTSEQFTSPSLGNGPVKYTVRQALPTGQIDTVGEFQAYSHRQDARDAARKLAKGV